MNILEETIYIELKTSCVISSDILNSCYSNSFFSEIQDINEVKIGCVNFKTINTSFAFYSGNFDLEYLTDDNVMEECFNELLGKKNKFNMNKSIIPKHKIYGNEFIDHVTGIIYIEELEIYNKFQSKGYGGCVIETIRQSFPNHNLTLLKSFSKNDKQKELNSFYKKNGFTKIRKSENVFYNFFEHH